MSNETAPQMPEPQEKPALSASESDSSISENASLDVNQDEVTEAASAEPVAVIQRRAPKLKSFFWVGAIVGILIGLINGISTSNPTDFNRGVYITVSVAFATMITTLITAAIVLVLEKRSVKNAQDIKRVIG